MVLTAGCRMMTVRKDAKNIRILTILPQRWTRLLPHASLSAIVRSSKRSTSVCAAVGAEGHLFDSSTQSATLAIGILSLLLWVLLLSLSLLLCVSSHCRGVIVVVCPRRHFSPPPSTLFPGWHRGGQAGHPGTGILPRSDQDPALFRLRRPQQYISHRLRSLAGSKTVA